MSTQANPYAKFLAGQDAFEVMAETVPRLEAAVERLGSAGMAQSYAPGKWSMNAVVCHLADCEIVFGYRWRQTANSEHHIIQPFDQDRWSSSYTSLDPKLALVSFLANRRLNLAWLKTLSPETLQKPVTHPERGELTFLTLLQTAAGHDLNHLSQFDQLLQARAGS